MIKIIGFDHKDSFDDGVTIFVHLDIEITDTDERKKLYELKKPHIEVRFSEEGVVSSEVMMYSLVGDEEGVDGLEWNLINLFHFTKEELDMIYNYIKINNLKEEC